MISLAKLRHFVLLARNGNYTRAAEAANLSQPALSRSIQSLELDYQAILFDRTSSGVELTRIGRDILQDAEDLLYNAAALGDRLSKAAKGMAGKVDFAVGPQLAHNMLDAAVKEVIVNHPDARLQVGIGSVVEMRRNLLGGLLDFYVGHYDEYTAHDRIATSHLGEGLPSFLVRPGHPLLTRELVELEDIAAFPRVCGSAWNESIDRKVDRDVREKLAATIEIDSTAIAVRLATGTDSILIGSLPRAHAPLLPLRVRLGVRFQPTLIGIHRLSSRTFSPLAANVAEIVSKYVVTALSGH